MVRCREAAAWKDGPTWLYGVGYDTPSFLGGAREGLKVRSGRRVIVGSSSSPSRYATVVWRVRIAQTSRLFPTKKTMQPPLRATPMRAACLKGDAGDVGGVGSVASLATRPSGQRGALDDERYVLLREAVLDMCLRKVLCHENNAITVAVAIAS